MFFKRKGLFVLNWKGALFIALSTLPSARVPNAPRFLYVSTSNTRKVRLLKKDTQVNTSASRETRLNDHLSLETSGSLCFICPFHFIFRELFHVTCTLSSHLTSTSLMQSHNPNPQKDKIKHALRVPDYFSICILASSLLNGKQQFLLVHCKLLSLPKVILVFPNS